MHRLFNTKLKYLLFLPFLFLIGNAVQFKALNHSIEDAMLRQKRLEIYNHIEMINAAINANPYKHWMNHELNLIRSVEFIDELPLVWAAVYKKVNNGLQLISERNWETDFDPLNYPEFHNAIVKESGEVVINAVLADSLPRDLYIYFVWMPDYTMQHEKYLVAAGVSKYSIVTKINDWIFISQAITLVITFVLHICLIILLIYLGDIYTHRSGRKWRSRSGNEY